MSCSNSAHACCSTVRICTWACRSASSASSGRAARAGSRRHLEVPAGVPEAAFAGGLAPHVAVAEQRELLGQEVDDGDDVAEHVGDHPNADLVGDVGQGVGEHQRRPPSVRSRLGRERIRRLRPAGHRQVVDPRVVEHRRHQVGQPVHRHPQPGQPRGVAPTAAATGSGAGRRASGARLVVRRQRRRDDVARGQVAVRRGVRGPTAGEGRDVGTHDGVDLVLGQRAARSSERRPGCPSTSSSHDVASRAGTAAVPRRVRPSRCVVSVSSCLAQLGQRPTRLLLVLQRAAEAEQGDGGRVGIDLDGPAATSRGGVDVEVAEPRRSGPPAGASANSALPVFEGWAPASNLAKSRLSARLGRPVARGVVAPRAGRRSRPGTAGRAADSASARSPSSVRTADRWTQTSLARPPPPGRSGRRSPQARSTPAYITRTPLPFCGPMSRRVAAR